ncbi:uncharacterized protein LOC111335643 [Stylophora pistillata]|nr:uncharacterized protein LOC111335643 [Stylophora pistillata]XP_022797361.1 uncharacterized protein LOC111335643 [Stylophora pistillata]XP_022797362.1 uncharacterized protein LOC111335643 [Stylophora pistillata]
MISIQLCLLSVFILILHPERSLLRAEGGCPRNENGGQQNWRHAVYQRKGKGWALKNHVFLSRTVRSEIECSLTCLRHERCESFNYRDNILEGPHICELNDQTRLTRSHDLLPGDGFSYYDSELKPCLKMRCQNGGTCHPVFNSRVAPYCCQCQERYTGDLCQHLKGFRFTNSSSGDHVSVSVGVSIEMTSLTVCFRFKAIPRQYGVSTPMSYVTNDFSCALQLYAKETVRIYIKDQFSDFPYVPLLDNTWHHVCFTWETTGGNVSLYIDGSLIGKKQSVSPGMTFNSSGSIVLGQLQKLVGGEFQKNESFFGDVTDVNIWKIELSLSAIVKLSEGCYSHMGNLISWYAFPTGTEQFDNVTNSISSECLGLNPYFGYDLEFPRRTNEDYVYGPTLSALSAFTLSLFVSFTDNGDKTYFNYYAGVAYNEIFIHERNNYFIVRIKDVKKQHRFAITPDGIWHHLAVTWENTNGSYEIFLDGVTVWSGNELEKGKKIRPGGSVVIGNDQDSIGFQARDAYVGNISRVNLWDHVLPRETITLLSQRCGKESGNEVSWRDFKERPFHGVVHIREPSSCQKLL